MRIGITKETKSAERRVGLTDAGVATLVGEDTAPFTYLHLAADRPLSEALIDAITSLCTTARQPRRGDGPDRGPRVRPGLNTRAGALTHGAVVAAQPPTTDH